ncbi:MAG TPA: glycoside hydrolase family 6 protein [Rugosimonospora sp.]|nr:glycoside hydrolase family 6 protein [Rugosimonospora sp.]
MIALAGGCGQNAVPRPAPAPDLPDLYVDPSTPAATEAARWESEGRTGDAAQLRKISDRPMARWLGNTSAGGRAEVDAYVGRAAADNRMPVLVAYYIPHRDCGNFSTGGAASGDAYRTWIREVAAGIGARPATVVLEPDAIAQALAGRCASLRGERFALLSYAVTVLKANSATRVYLDAGHPRWIADLAALAGALRASGIAQADGFALNISNFISTDENIAYGQRLSTQLGGAHFVIDTSRNGAGPVATAQVDGGPAWCNPPGRALGPAPTTRTGRPGVDMLLWVKRPGESDGACRPGEPAAGQWWPQYALDLAEHSP